MEFKLSKETIYRKWEPIISSIVEINNTEIKKLFCLYCEYKITTSENFNSEDLKSELKKIKVNISKIKTKKISVKDFYLDTVSNEIILKCEDDKDLKIRCNTLIEDESHGFEIEKVFGEEFANLIKSE